MNIILISGKAQHGKDTCANYIKDILESRGQNVLIAHYGDLVKYFCEKFWGWDGVKDDYGRSLLQKVGTDIVRKEMPNYWVEQVTNMIKFSMRDHIFDTVIIPDVRFPNEIDINHYFYDIEEKDRPVIYSIRVEREKYNKLGWKSPLTEEQQKHISETSLDDWDFEYYINNDFGLACLSNKCNEFVYKYM